MADHDSTGKAPAFQFYPKDFLTDENVRVMSLQERGAYITLICLCWLEGTLPADLGRLSRLCGVSVGVFRRLWPALEACFRVHSDRPGRLIQPRLERERRKRDEFSSQQAERGKLGAEKRWGKDGGAIDSPSLKNSGAIDSPMAKNSSSSPISDLRSPDLQNVSSAAQAPPEPPVLVFPVIGVNGHEWSLTDRQVAEWVELFPTLDVLAEARKALAWVRSDLGHRKTARGMPRFLTRWLTRATDDRGGRSGQESKPRNAVIFSPADPNAVAWLEECRTLHGGACGASLSRHVERMGKAKATA